MTVDDLLNEFQKQEEVRACRRPKGAFSQCAQISKRLVAEAQRAGFSAEMLRLEGETWNLREEAWCRDRGLNPYTAWCHHIVKIGEEYIDYTWRQFYPKSEFPVRKSCLNFWQEYFRK